MKILITGAWQDAKKEIPKLEALGHEIVFLLWEQDKLPCAYEEIEGVIGNGLFCHHPIEKFTSLRYIQLTSAGLDGVPVEYIRQHGITLHNARGVYSIPMAEFAVCGVLQLFKQSSFFKENQKKHVWEKKRDLRELWKKTVCVIGCGSVGTACARLFKAFGCRIIGVEAVPKSDENFDEMVGLSGLYEALRKADVVLLCLPLTKETRHLMNAERLAAMKDEAVLVNISRGAVVDTEALKKALDEKRLLGAVLDVFEEEPLEEGSALWDREDVILTPHCSFVGDGNGERLLQVIRENLLKFTKEQGEGAL